MPKRLYNFIDPVFNEWLFDLLSNLRPDEKDKLNETEINLIRNRKELGKFVTNGNLEKKLTILTKLNVEWHILMYRSQMFTPSMILEVYRQYAIKGKRLEMIEEMFRKKIFVLSSKDVALSLAMMNQNIHTTGYIINPAFLSFHKAIKNLKKLSADIKVREAQLIRDSQQVIARFILSFLNADGYMESQFNLQPMDIGILCLLFCEPNNYVRMDYIREQMKPYKKLSLGIRCAYLWKERGMIDKMPSNEREPSYKIVQSGILALGSLFNRLISNAETR